MEKGFKGPVSRDFLLPNTRPYGWTWPGGAVVVGNVNEKSTSLPTRTFINFNVNRKFFLNIVR